MLELRPVADSLHQLVRSYFPQIAEKTFAVYYRKLTCYIWLVADQRMINDQSAINLQAFAETDNKQGIINCRKSEKLYLLLLMRHEL